MSTPTPSITSPTSTTSPTSPTSRNDKNDKNKDEGVSTTTVVLICVVGGLVFTALALWFFKDTTYPQQEFSQSYSQSYSRPSHSYRRRI